MLFHFYKSGGDLQISIMRQQITRIASVTGKGKKKRETHTHNIALHDILNNFTSEETRRFDLTPEAQSILSVSQ